MGHPDALDREEMIDFVMSCWDDEAGATAVPHYPFGLV
jgi:geranylgeranyl transferase type-2 subunit beta